MEWILIVGVLISALVAYLFRGRPRLVAVTRILTSHGFSEDTIAAIGSEPADAEVTLTLANGTTFKTTAGEAARRLRPGAEGKPPSWLFESSTNWLSLVLFVLGSALSILLFVLSKS